MQSRQFVDDAFNGSLPAFIAEFTRRKDLSAGRLILAVAGLLLLLKKAPKWAPCVLWALVAVRLVCPFAGGDGASIFTYNGVDYDMAERNQAINALADRYPVGKSGPHGAEKLCLLCV